MRVQPSQEWLRRFASASMPLLSSCNGHALAALAGAMGRLWQASNAHDAPADVKQRGSVHQGWAPHQPCLLDPDSEMHCPMAAWSMSLLRVAQCRLRALSSCHSEEIRRQTDTGLSPEDVVSLALALPLLQRIYSCEENNVSTGERVGVSQRLTSSSLSDDLMAETAIGCLAPPPCFLSDLTAAVLRLMPLLSATQMANILMALARIDKHERSRQQSPQGNSMLSTLPVDGG